MKVTVVGAGGVGGYFGGLLARAGHEVTFVARGAHLDAIRRNGGLQVESQNDGHFLAPGRGAENTAEAGVQDLVLFNVKMHHNPAAIASLPPMIGSGTVVLTLQNGIDNGEQIADVIGLEPVMIGSAFMEGRISEPGVVTQGGPGTGGFGEMTVGITERGERLHREFQEAGWRVDLHENMVGMLWKKFAYIAGSAAVCAAANCVYEEMRNIPATPGPDPADRGGGAGRGAGLRRSDHGRFAGLGHGIPGPLPRPRTGINGQGLHRGPPS